MNTTKITTVTAALALTLALAACGSGDDSGSASPSSSSASAEPTSQAERDAKVEEDPKVKEAEKKADEDMEDIAGDPWSDLETYEDAYSLGQSVGGADYWDNSDGGHSLDCTKVNQETSQVRDEYTGEVVDVTTIDCERAGTGEQATMTVAGDFDEGGDIAGPVCDELLEGDSCFTGKGWTIETMDTGHLKEMLEALDIDPKDWAVGETFEDYDEDGMCVGEAPCD